MSETVVRAVDGGRVDLAWFITPHGFGHAARASAVIAACSERVEGLRHHLFTTVPAEFFVDSLRDIDWRLLDHQCDVGMIQCDPFSRMSRRLFGPSMDSPRAEARNSTP